MTKQSGSDLESVRDILEKGALSVHFQPIVQLDDGKIVGHESLVRLPANAAFRSPDEFFAAARSEKLTLEAEHACLAAGFDAWAPLQLDTRVFLNLSAAALIETFERLTMEGVLRGLHVASVSPSSLVVEITEHERVADLPRLIAVTSQLQAAGVRFAFDDFGDGASSLRLWAELRPEIVKIDKYFVRNIATEPVKVQTLRGLTQLAETFGTVLVAEGIETEEELRVVRDLGIELGQGYFLGRPQVAPASSLLPAAQEVIASYEIAMLPAITRAAGADFTVARLAVRVPPLSPQERIGDVAQRLLADPALRAIALVDDGRPVGLINRQAFFDNYAKPYFKDLYSHEPCILFADTSPLVLDRRTGLEGMTAVLKSPDQRYLTDGFVVTEGGKYLGLGTGEQLVRVVTEVRIEAARHANPLTFLPGNIPISEHIDRLLSSGGEFVACYADLNDFKPYNDLYGYWRGDDMIRLVARTLVSHCDPRRDFVGHVGGDDFVVLFQSHDWMSRCERLLASFNANALKLFDEEAVARGGIDAEDRHGMTHFFKCTTLSLGAVPVRPGAFKRAEQVASAAAMAKRTAKTAPRGLAVEDF